MAEHRPLTERVPTIPKEISEDFMMSLYKPVKNNAFEPWIGLKAIRPLDEWVPADYRVPARWALDNDVNTSVVAGDLADYGPNAALVGLHPRMTLRHGDRISGTVNMGAKDDFEEWPVGEPAWVLHERLWDDIWRAQSSVQCMNVLKHIFANDKQGILSFADLVRRSSEGDTAVTGGGSVANRFGVRTSKGWFRTAPAMCSIGQRGRDYSDEPGTLYALDANVTMLTPLANEEQSPGIAIRHAIVQCTLPSGKPGTGARVWAHMNNYSVQEHFTSEPDPNNVLLISVLGATNSKLTAVVMLEGYYDWLTSLLHPGEAPHGLYLSVDAQKNLQRAAQKILNCEDSDLLLVERQVRNWLEELIPSVVSKQSGEIVVTQKLTWGNWLGQIALHDAQVEPRSGLVHELLTGVYTEAAWSDAVKSHWGEICDAIKKWNVDWSNLETVPEHMGQMPDALPEESKLAESSLNWTRYGQIARALLNEEHHPFLQNELVENSKSIVGAHVWPIDTTICRCHPRELFITSKVGEVDHVEMTVVEDLNPGKEKKVFRAEVVLGILPELTSVIAQYREDETGWFLCGIHIVSCEKLSAVVDQVGEHLLMSRLAAMTLMLALSISGVLTGTGKYACWSDVGSPESVDGMQTVDCDIPIELAGKLWFAKLLNQAIFVVPLTPNDSAIFMIEDKDAEILHATHGFVHCETGHVADWFCGLESSLQVFKVGMRSLLSRNAMSVSIPSGSSLEWIVVWASDHLGITIPSTTEINAVVEVTDAQQQAATNSELVLNIRRSKWSLFKCETLSGTVSAKKLVEVKADFKRQYGGCFRGNSWAAVEFFLRHLAQKAGFNKDNNDANRISISELTNSIIWYSVICNRNLWLSPADKAVWAPPGQRDDSGFHFDRRMKIPSWQGRHVDDNGEMTVLVTEKQSICFGKVRGGGGLRFEMREVPTTGSQRTRYVGGDEIFLEPHASL